ncbi:hypothetical protein Mal15_12160 [Stieleria maiorica]|uniref:Uncharacterized protein n=1 Tax=Stieleria maiorica TaxID=2795974 RepID=A0A5B9M7K1_9BACT|nr:hypothetical protein Mal15_12160 [Stieleria maiorica]
MRRFMSLIEYATPGPAMISPVKAVNEAATKSGVDFRRFDVDCDGGWYGFTTVFVSVGERLP